MLVLASEWPGTRSLAQLVVAPKACLSSQLKQAPLLKMLNLRPLGEALALWRRPSLQKS